MKIITLLCITLFVVGVAAPQQLAAQSEKTKSFKGIKSIRMTTSSGDCKIQRSADTGVTVALRTTDDYDKNVEVTMEQEGDQLVIKETYHHRNTHGSANWTLTIPEGLKIKFHTGSGNITITDLKMDLDAVTGSGDLEFSKVSGQIEATTGSGDLTLQDSNGEIEVTIGSGSAVVQNTQGNIKLTCGSGNIRVADSNAAFAMTTGSGDVVSKNITLNGSSSFTSGSGDTNVILAATPKYNISLASGSGNAELDFNGHEIVGEVVMQANKRNGNITAPFDFEKVEEIENGHDQITVKKTAVKGGGSNRVRVSTGSGDAVLKK
jgi:Putative adhesin